MNLNTVDNIIWLGNSERILTLDFHPFYNILAIGGSQSPYDQDDEASQGYQDEQGYIKLWEFFPDNNKKNEQVKFIRGLQGHQKCVNGLRFSPNGQYLASCSDDNKIKIWEMQWVNRFGGQRIYTWEPIKSLEGHSGEVLDIEWSSDGKYLVSAGFDKRSIVWEVEKNKYISVLDGHKGPVKGISFDPLMKFIISQGEDRQVKVYKNVKTAKKSKKQLNFMIKNNVQRIEYKKQKQQDAMVSEDDPDISNVTNINSATFPLFIQENSLSCFVKRPHWSPDGQIFMVPAAQYAENEGEKPKPCVLGFKRTQINKPSLVIPTNGFPAIAVRFMNKLFKLQDGQEKILDLDYQAIYAIATTETVAIHSTQRREPLVVVGNIHYALLNDLSWFEDRSLGICSTDGYCTFCNFKPGYFGEELSQEDYDNLDEEIRSALIHESYYTQDLLKQLIGNSIENLQKKPQAPTPKMNLQLSASTQVQIVTDQQGNKKKRIIPVSLSKQSQVQQQEPKQQQQQQPQQQQPQQQLQSQGQQQQ